MVNTKKIRKSGSVNIPIALRRSLNIRENDAVDITESEGKVIITPAVPRCLICSSQEGIVRIHGKCICKNCAKAVVEGGE